MIWLTSPFLFLESLEVIMAKIKAQNVQNHKKRTKNGGRGSKRKLAIAGYVISLVISAIGLFKLMLVALFVQPMAIIALYNIYRFRIRKSYQLNTFPIAYAVGISLHILFSLLLFVWWVTSAV